LCRANPAPRREVLELKGCKRALWEWTTQQQNVSSRTPEEASVDRAIVQKNHAIDKSRDIVQQVQAAIPV
jgi:hypothetical protein